MFQSPLGEVVKETDEKMIAFLRTGKFQSPLGEVVKETQWSSASQNYSKVSIPSRGSGKGDNVYAAMAPDGGLIVFQSPLGEVVKETRDKEDLSRSGYKVSIPSRGSGKGDSVNTFNFPGEKIVSIPSRGSGKGDLLIQGSGPVSVSFNPLSGKW